MQKHLTNVVLVDRRRLLLFSISLLLGAAETADAQLSSLQTALMFACSVLAGVVRGKKQGKRWRGESQAPVGLPRNRYLHGVPAV